MAQELDLSDLWNIRAKGPNVIVEVNDETSGPAKAPPVLIGNTSLGKAENKSASAQEGSGMKNPLMSIAVMAIVILVLVLCGILALKFSANSNGLAESVIVRNPFPGVGSGDPRFNGLNQGPDFNALPARQAFNQGSRPQDRCNQAKSRSEVPQNAINVEWDEGICAYHYQMP
jgi:hypothetical protein